MIETYVNNHVTEIVEAMMFIGLIFTSLAAVFVAAIAKDHNL
jgi:hypothetical protein